MADAPLGYFEQIQSIWKRLTTSQRVSLVAFTGGVLLGLVVLVLFMNAPDYQTLYSGLNSDDANAVVTKLKERKIPYVLADGGSTIKVPAEKIDETRLQMASSGLPQSGRIGFEIFDKTNFGATDFTTQVNYRRALEGELERTIRNLDEVSQVRVHLVLPKESLFSEKTEPAKASVVIRLKSGRQLAPGSVNGITHLVSSAVEGLRPESVSILDAHGKVLAPLHAMEGVPGGLTPPELALQRQAEKDLTAKVISILEPVVGAGKVRADTSLLLDFNSSELTEEIYSPSANAVLSQQKTEEKLLSGAAIAGIPGTRSNQPGAQPPAPPSPAPDTRVKQSEMTNYEVSRTVRRTTIPKGSIKKISVAVVVDDKPAPKKDGRSGAAVPLAPRTQEDMDHLRSLVMTTVGYSKERGDQITVENISFESARPPEPDKPASLIGRYPEYVRMLIHYGSLMLLALLTYFIVLRPLKRRMMTPLEPAAAPALLRGSSTAAAAEAGAKMEADAVKGLAATDARAAAPEPPDIEALQASIEAELGQDLNTEGLRMTALKKKIFEMAKKEPQSTAFVLRAWLEESHSKRR